MIVKIDSELKDAIYDLLWIDYGEFQQVDDETELEKLLRVKILIEMVIKKAEIATYLTERDDHDT